MILRSTAVVLILLTWLLAGGCSSVTSIGEGVVSAERVRLRQSTGRVPGDAGELQRGDQVVILDEEGDFLKVRAQRDKTLEGWLDRREIVNSEVIEKTRTLEESVKNIPTQANGKLRQDSKLRLTPNREDESNVVFLVPRETKLEILDRKRTPAPGDKDESGRPTNRLDTWYQVRLPKEFVGRVGWLYASNVELDVPPEIAIYENSGLKFIAWHSVGTVTDEESGEVNNYVILQKQTYGGDPKADFDRIYALAWDPTTHSYHSMFVQSGLRGVLPLRVDEMGEQRYKVIISLLGKNDEPQEMEFLVSRSERGRYTMTRTTAAKPRSS